MSAECLFTDKKYILAALQEKNGKLVLSGLGGKKEETDECIIDTAIRETLEELFHIHDIPSHIVKYLMIHYIPRNQFINGDYHVLVYDFYELSDFLHICQGFGLKSPLYESFPRTINDLILRRKILPEAEVKQLALLPFIQGLELCKHFASDIDMLSKL